MRSIHSLQRIEIPKASSMNKSSKSVSPFLSCAIFLSLLCTMSLIMVSTTVLPKRAFELVFADDSDYKGLKKQQRVAVDSSVKPYAIFFNACLRKPNLATEHENADHLKHQYEIAQQVDDMSETGDVMNQTMQALHGQTSICFSPFLGHSVKTKTHQFNVVADIEKPSEHFIFLSVHQLLENNFHLQNDNLLSFYRVSKRMSQFNISHFLLLKGRAWEDRLPLFGHFMKMIRATVLFSLEDYVVADQPLCMDRLIVQVSAINDCNLKLNGTFPRIGYPFYSHKDRFTEMWQPELFTSYRDDFLSYFRELSVSQSKQEKHGSRAVDATSFSNGSSTRRPLLTYVSRGIKDHARRQSNRDELLSVLRLYFTVQVIDFSHGMTVEESIELVSNTDILIGPHGAGLGCISFLSNSSMVVELENGNKKLMFLNMASKMNIPYYTASFQPHVPLSNHTMHILAKDLVDAFEYETKQWEAMSNEYLVTGDCEFPLVEPCPLVDT